MVTKVLPTKTDLTITVTEAARGYFKRLLEKEEVEGMNLRAFAANPGTIHADVSVTFCPAGEEESSDIALSFEEEDFVLYIANDSKEALRDAVIDFKTDKVGGQLSIKAPYLKGKAPATDSPLHDRIQYVIDSEINPGLAGHGGKVSISEIKEPGIVILQFGGGCHGCGMAGVTLKHGIEKTLKEKFPEITEILDATDHATGTNPYY